MIHNTLYDGSFPACKRSRQMHRNHHMIPVVPSGTVTFISPSAAPNPQHSLCPVTSSARNNISLALSPNLTTLRIAYIAVKEKLQTQASIAQRCTQWVEARKAVGSKPHRPACSKQQRLIKQVKLISARRNARKRRRRKEMGGVAIAKPTPLHSILLPCAVRYQREEASQVL